MIKGPDAEHRRPVLFVIMKYWILIFFLMLAAFSYSYKNYYRFVYSNLIIHESQGRHYCEKGEVLKSKSEAWGRCQITEICLQDFNDRNPWGIKYTIEDIKLKFPNKVVSKWYFYDRLFKYYKGDIIKMVNAYNMGIGNTDRGKFNVHYLKDIVPVEFDYWIRSAKIIKKYAKIWIIKTD